jgi:hypothetical protein
MQRQQFGGVNAGRLPSGQAAQRTVEQSVMFWSTGTHAQQSGGRRAGVCPSGHSAQRTFEQGPPGPPCAAAAVPVAAVDPAAVPVPMLPVPLSPALVSVVAVPAVAAAPAAVEVSPGCVPAQAPSARTAVRTIISNNNLFMKPPFR